VKYKHSWDLLLVNFAKVVFWFNPLIYLFEKSLREVHEYQADHGVTSSFARREYATLLLRLISGRPGWQFMNNFNQFQTKKRILMMSKSGSRPQQKLRFLALFPILGLLLFVFSCERDDMNPLLSEEFSETMEVPLTDRPAPNPPFVDPKNMIESAADEVFDVVEQQPNPEGGMSGWNRYLAMNLQYPAKARQMGIEGTVIVVFEIHTDGSIHKVEILRGIGGGADEEAIRVVQNAPKWEPGKQRGRAVKTRMRLPIRFKLASLDDAKNQTIPYRQVKMDNPVISLKEITVVGYVPAK
jgi:TonB family protein